MYIPTIGRFMQEDPIVDDPTNTYRYVRNNPLIYTDPMGTEVYVQGTRTLANLERALLNTRIFSVDANGDEKVGYPYALFQLPNSLLLTDAQREFEERRFADGARRDGKVEGPRQGFLLIPEPAERSWLYAEHNQKAVERASSWLAKIYKANRDYGNHVVVIEAPTPQGFVVKELDPSNLDRDQRITSFRIWSNISDFSGAKELVGFEDFKNQTVKQAGLPDILHLLLIQYPDDAPALIDLALRADLEIDLSHMALWGGGWSYDDGKLYLPYGAKGIRIEHTVKKLYQFLSTHVEVLTERAKQPLRVGWSWGKFREWYLEQNAHNPSDKDFVGPLRENLGKNFEEGVRYARKEANSLFWGTYVLPVTLLTVAAAWKLGRAAFAAESMGNIRPYVPPRIYGVAQEDASALARSLKGVQVEGKSAVASVEAFGSRVGSRFRGRGPTPSSDLDLFVTYKNDVVNSAAARRVADAQIDEIADLFRRTKGIKVEVIKEIETLAPRVKSGLKETPFIALD